MSSDLLRRAAKTLREHAENATPGPWRVCAEGSEGSRIAPAEGTLRERGRFIGIMNGRVQPEDGRNAAYAVLMHPPVALHLADHLDDFADSLDQDGGIVQDSGTAGAIDIAAALLRERP